MWTVRWGGTTQADLRRIRPKNHTALKAEIENVLGKAPGGIPAGSPPSTIRSGEYMYFPDCDPGLRLYFQNDSAKRDTIIYVGERWSVKATL